jgi:5-methylcytosine-specific restriction endonuclease McrA
MSTHNSGHVKVHRRPALLARPERHWCAYCAWHAEGWDHVEPWSQSRDNGMDNLVPCCRQCNTDKRDLPVVVFLALTIGALA